jgi:predicted nucleic acid-binding Zn ribbon protein
MERAAQVVKNTKFSKKILSDDDLARAVWPAAVGKSIAAHTSRVKLVRSTLVVEVEDAIWQKQLFMLSRQILERLHRVTGSAAITDVEFRVGLKRRAPQRAESPHKPLFTSDEADQIQDPVLKKLYLLSRKKATA